MSVEKGVQDKETAKSGITSEKVVVQKKSTGIVSKLSLLISLVAVGLAGYVVINSNSESKDVLEANQTYSTLQTQYDKLKLNQDQQRDILDDVSAQDDAQKDSIKAIQSQLTLINSQIATPTKDLYLQMSVVNIQAAIDYLILAKDVVLFSGDTAKAVDLISVAFDKVEASKVANISAGDRQNIKQALSTYVSKEDVIKKFISIQDQFGELRYITPESLNENIKTQSIKNKYLAFLNSVVEIQDIPKTQKLVATREAKQAVADNLYQSLIDLQTAMYTNNKVSIGKAKESLLMILEKYFVQDSVANTLEKSIAAIKPQGSQQLNNSLDKIISSLTEQQNALLTRNNSNQETMGSKKESEK